MRAIVCLLAGLLASGGAWAAGPAQTTLGAALANPAGIRGALGVGPNMLNITDPAYGGKADAQRGASHFSVQGSKVNVATTLVAKVHVTVASGSNVLTIQETAAVPVVAGMVSNGYWVQLPGAGASGGTLYAGITATNPAAGTITLSGTAGTQLDGSAISTLTIWIGNDPDAFATLTASYYDAITVAGNTVTFPTAQMTYGSAAQNGTQRIAITGAGSGGGVYFGRIATQSNDGRTFTVYPPPPTPLTASNQLVTWGLFMFDPDDAGKSIELPLAGSGTNPYTGLPASIVGTIVSVESRSAATITAAVPTNVDRKDAVLTKGSDDWPAYQAAVASLSNAMRFDYPSILYFPRDSFMASASNDQTLAGYVLQCGDGNVIWPAAFLFNHGSGSCLNRTAPAFPNKSDLIPEVHLKRLKSLTAGSTAVVVFAGNSQISEGSNKAGYTGQMAHQICEAIQLSYPDLTIVCRYRGIGGTTWGEMDPNGPLYNGSVRGVPRQANLNYGGWYTDNTKPWVSYYIQNDAPDVLIINQTNNEGMSTSYGSMLNVVDYTQTSAWATATGKNPDIILIADNPQPLNYTGQFGSDFEASLTRGFARAGNYTLANGGKIGIIDFNRMAHIAIDGYDPIEPPLRAFSAIPTGIGGSFPISFPVAWTSAQSDFSWPFFIRHSTASPSVAAFWTAAGGEIDWLIGGGGNAVPANNSYIGGAAVGYPGPYLRLFYNSGTGFLEYQVDTIFFQTAANCSGTSGASTLTCTTAAANIGHQKLSISVPNGATGGATPLVTKIATVSLDGKTITLAAPLGATVSNVAPSIYRTQIPRKASGILAANFGGDSACGITAGTATSYKFLAEIRGHHLQFSMCGVTGSSIEETIERPTTPFVPQLTLAAGSPAAMKGTWIGDGVTLANNGATQTFVSDLNVPEYMPAIRMYPDMFGSCPNLSPQPIGAAVPTWGGTCATHSGNRAASAIRAPVVAGTRWR